MPAITGRYVHVVTAGSNLSGNQFQGSHRASVRSYVTPAPAADLQVTQVVTQPESFSGEKTTVLWTVDPSDWLERDPQAIATVILDGLTAGAIIDLHDCWPRHTSTEADRTPTVEALRIALPEMDARGYRSVTVSELLASAPIAPG